MRINEKGLELIKEFEGLVPYWYRDPVGVWTCCYGHTDAAGEPKHATTKGKQFSQAEADEILRRDLGKYEGYVARYVKVPLNENQHGALVSFVFNLGPGNLSSSTLLKKLNAGDYAGAAGEFTKWNKAGGKTLAGLTRRRKAERDLFLTVTARPSPKPIYPSPSTHPVPSVATIPIVLIGVLLVAAFVLVKVFGG